MFIYFKSNQEGCSAKKCNRQWLGKVSACVAGQRSLEVIGKDLNRWPGFIIL